MKINHLLLNVLALALAAVSCDKTPAPVSGDPMIEASKDTVRFAAGSTGPQTLEVHSNRTWKAVATADWLSVSPSECETVGTTTVTLSLTEANQGYTDYATVTFSTGSEETSVVVVREGSQGEKVIEQITCAEFISRADTTTTYKLVGTVSGFNSEYCSFDLNDGTATVVVWKVNAESKAKYSNVIKNGGLVTVTGTYTLYTSGTGSVKHEILDGNILAYENAAAVDYNACEQISVSEFISNADVNKYYKLVGKVSQYKEGTTTSKKNYINFNLTDSSGTIYVYGCSAESTEQYFGKNTIKEGDEVTLAAKYSFYDKTSTHEAVDAVILNVKPFDASQKKIVTTESIAEVLAANDMDSIIFNNAVVWAVAKTGYILTDSNKSDFVFVYDSDSLKVGDVVNVNAAKSVYSEMPQLANASAQKVSTTAVSYPEATDISAGFDNFSSNKIVPVCFTGNLAISGNYYNITVPGATKNIGATLFCEEYDPKNFAGVDNVTYTGYYIYKSSGKYVYILLTKPAEVSSAAYFNVSPSETTVKADAGSLDISISGNVDWTASSDNADFQPAVSSGSGATTLKVNYTSTTEARTAKITVSTTAEVATKSYTVTINQKAPSSGEGFEKVESLDEITAGSYVITFEHSELTGEVFAMTTAAATKNPAGKKVTVSAGVIDESDAEGCVWTVTGNNTDGFTFAAESNFLNAKKDSQGLSISSKNDMKWTFSEDATYGLLMKSKPVLEDRCVAAYNSSGNVTFRFYKTGTNYKGKLVLYKQK